eukprot:CAMPEP_0170390376 /NCGR_PEP_ID=MMETSP0117_2-20130122/19114_1 /TAXON_ID=400756 /ORGANISM="Durinskia baltica, Strain CSIRO CS-38" /LENGTH=430 /DNA_ID=CAMNT_0010646419 /DNA_START=125 /DNA_END=1420 /DNA_ORIENTATION=+
MTFCAPPSSGNKSQARAARQARHGTAVAQNSSESNNYFLAGLFGISALVGITGYLMNEVVGNPKGRIAQTYSGSVVEQILKTIHRNTFGQFSQLMEPSSDSLLPDWPTAPCYAEVPPGTPCPPTLIIDLEKTLVGSVHDVKYGWRHVKRPGAEKFLQQLSQYYEVVIFSENDIGVVQEIMLALDPSHTCHYLGADAAEVRGTTLLKRLDKMNRDTRRIIVIDDNPESVQLCMDNVLLVPPFTDVNSKTDRVLENLIPLLQAFVHDGAEDFTKTIDDLGTHDAEEAVAEYRMRLAAARQAEKRRRNQYLGGILRGQAAAVEEDDGFAPKSAILSASDIVGSSREEVAYNAKMAQYGGTENKKNFFNKDKPKPSDVKKKGYLFETLDKSQEASKEMEQVKLDKMNQIYQKRMEEKARRAQEMQLQQQEQQQQ